MNPGRIQTLSTKRILNSFRRFVVQQNCNVFWSTYLFCAAFIVNCSPVQLCEFGENYGEAVKIFPEHAQVKLRAGYPPGSTYFIALLLVTFTIIRLSISHHGRRRKRIWLKQS